MCKSIKDFPEDVQDTVYEILANAAERKAEETKQKEATSWEKN